ncbi:hypothetical protein [Acinetobacter sp. ANC 4173]|uniref:hypothetical protein n=1 Tax=Acinetobacter sp. ANC 4173 TaxID=2529837 RepID=UPI0010395A15|nr:hypothetical protein [Acinetobacter sp. ANC 4173]TCB80033.1 hypothetical protein E0H94_09445 [Acinetobacter sp. ANC 4173]
MNMIKTALMSTAFFASASVFANVAVNGQVNASAEAQGNTHSVLHSIHEGVTTSAQKVGNGLSTATENVGHGIQHTSTQVGQGLSTASQRVGQGIEKGAEHSKSTSKAVWSNTKQFSAEQAQKVNQTATKTKDYSAEKAERTQAYLGQKTQQGKATTQHTWNKTKTALSTPAQADVNAQVGVHTPVAKTQVGVSSQTAVNTAK